MVTEADVKVKLKAEGGEEVKQQLLETRAAMVGVSTEQLKNAQTQRQAARDAQLLNNAEAYKTRIFLAQNPALNSLSRAMSVYGNVSRGVLAVTTAFSTAMVAFRGTTSGLLETQIELEQARREQILALSRYGYDSEEYADATGKVNVLNERFRELLEQGRQERVTGLLNLVGAIGIIGGSIVTILSKVAPSLQVFGAMAIRIGSLTLPLVGLIGSLASVIGGVATALYLILTPGDQVADMLKELGIDASGLSKSMDDAVFRIIGTFTFMGSALMGVFIAIKNAFTEMWNNMVSTVVNAVSSIIAQVRSALEWLARLPGNIAGGIATGIGSLIQQQRRGPVNSRAGGGLITEPVMGIGLNSGQTWTFGESGTEMVTPMGGRSAGSGGGGGGVVVINFNNPTFTGELEFERRVDGALKKILKKHGWT